MLTRNGLTKQVNAYSDLEMKALNVFKVNKQGTRIAC